MSVRDDLIAAKALIDTPPKFLRFAYPKRGDKHFMQQVAQGNVSVYAGMARALDDALLNAADDLSDFLRGASHADIMSLFDRAIAAQEQAS